MENWKDDFKVGDKVLTPTGRLTEIVNIIDDLYWLKNGLYAYKFELRKYEETD